MYKKNLLDRYENLAFITFVGGAPVAMFVKNMYSSKGDFDYIFSTQFGFYHEVDYMLAFPGEFDVNSAIPKKLNYKHPTYNDDDLEQVKDDTDKTDWYIDHVGTVFDHESFTELVSLGAKNCYDFDIFDIKVLPVYPTLKEMKNTATYRGAKPEDRKKLRYLCVDWKPSSKRESAAINEKA